ncbi:hypothetical protein MMC19_005881 [Ptychographa xylographoides]|nr:hypothetical protein [Ptychographa xylographoides]
MKVSLLLRLILLSFAVTPSNSETRCTPSLGLDISQQDCAKALHDLFDPVFRTIPQSLLGTSQLFGIHAINEYSRMPRGITVGTCSLAIDIESFTGDVATSSWFELYTDLYTLIQACVVNQPRGSGGTSIKAPGFVFTIVNPALINVAGTCMASQGPKRVDVAQCVLSTASRTRAAVLRAPEDNPPQDPHPLSAGPSGAGPSDANLLLAGPYAPGPPQNSRLGSDGAGPSSPGPQQVTRPGSADNQMMDWVAHTQPGTAAGPLSLHPPDEDPSHPNPVDTGAAGAGPPGIAPADIRSVAANYYDLGPPNIGDSGVSPYNRYPEAVPSGPPLRGPGNHIRSLPVPPTPSAQTAQDIYLGDGGFTRARVAGAWILTDGGWLAGTRNRQWKGAGLWYLLCGMGTPAAFPQGDVPRWPGGEVWTHARWESDDLYEGLEEAWIAEGQSWKPLLGFAPPSGSWTDTGGWVLLKGNVI